MKQENDLRISLHRQDYFETMHGMAHNVRGLCVRAGFETPNFKLSTDDK